MHVSVLLCLYLVNIQWQFQVKFAISSCPSGDGFGTQYSLFPDPFPVIGWPDRPVVLIRKTKIAKLDPRDIKFAIALTRCLLPASKILKVGIMMDNELCWWNYLPSESYMWDDD